MVYCWIVGNIVVVLCYLYIYYVGQWFVIDIDINYMYFCFGLGGEYVDVGGVVGYICCLDGGDCFW